MRARDFFMCISSFRNPVRQLSPKLDRGEYHVARATSRRDAGRLLLYVARRSRDACRPSYKEILEMNSVGLSHKACPKGSLHWYMVKGAVGLDDRGKGDGGESRHLSTRTTGSILIERRRVCR